MRAKQLGLHLKADGQGVIDGQGNVIAWRSEEEIFKALNMDYVPPEERVERDELGKELARLADEEPSFIAEIGRPSDL